MKDYRLPENRREYFTALYRMNLEHGVMPGLVYLYMPELAKRFGLDDEQKLWFAFLNGMTQNPITSLRIFQQLPECPPAVAQLTSFSEWFNDEWDTLQFDTDRRYQKKDTVEAIKAYAKAVDHFGSQADMLREGTAYSDLWARVTGMYKSFGRLSAFSYLEYVKIMGFGSDCDRMFFDDKSGSKSHRNGMLFLLGMDHLVWDKRQPNSNDGNYDNFKGMCSWLERQADEYLNTCGIPGANRFTMESNLCTTKNHYFSRRYPGVYADMAWDRIVWAEERSQHNFTKVFRDIREDNLPDWLREECEAKVTPRAKKAAQFAETGFPFRGEYFLEV